MRPAKLRGWSRYVQKYPPNDNRTHFLLATQCVLLSRLLALYDPKETPLGEREIAPWLPWDGEEAAVKVKAPAPARSKETRSEQIRRRNRESRERLRNAN